LGLNNPTLFRVYEGPIDIGPENLLNLQCKYRCVLGGGVEYKSTVLGCALVEDCEIVIMVMRPWLSQ